MDETFEPFADGTTPIGDHQQQLSQLLSKLQVHPVDNQQDTTGTFSTNGGLSYSIKALIGEGGFGSVYRCSPQRGQTTGTSSLPDSAVKIINVPKLAIITGCSQSALLYRMLQEVQILQCIGTHDHIVKLHWAGVSQDPHCVFLVMELMYEDLFNELVRRRKPFAEPDGRKIISQLVSAVRHCHDLGVAHRDIKLENIMVARVDPLWIKLGDYGQAKAVGDLMGFETKVATSKTLTTTKLYTPPEVQHAAANNAGYDAFKVDSFGIGVVLYGILCSALPDAAKGNYEKNNNFGKLSQNGQDLVRQLLNSDPGQRLSAQMVHLHPWLTALPGVEESTPRAADSCLPPSPARSAYDDELQALLSVQRLNKALQRERGASCWMLYSSGGVLEHRWRCELTTTRLVDTEESILPMRGPRWANLREILQHIRGETGKLRQTCQDAAMMRGVSPGEDAFDKIFSSYCRLLDSLIGWLSDVLTTFTSSDSHAYFMIRHRLLLLVAEQLGRERGFLIGHMSQPEKLHSLPVRMRFARIQGARQLLLGCASTTGTDEVVADTFGLMSFLHLSEDSPLSAEDLLALEQAEAQVFEGKTGTHEWFALLTKIIDKVHAHISVGMMTFFGQLSLESGNGSLESAGSSIDHGLLTLGDLEGVSRSSSNFVGTTNGAMPMKIHPSSLMGTPEATPIHPMFKKSAPAVPMGELAQLIAASCSPPEASSRSSPPPEVVPTRPPLASAPPMPPIASAPEPSQGEVFITKGTIGHPDSCSGTGCKYSRRPRGCKDGKECIRCHLCVWKRSSERTQGQGKPNPNT